MTDMENFVFQYIEEAKRLFSQIEVTIGRTTSITFTSAILHVIDLLLNEKIGKVILIGNGGSASIASEVANRFWKFCHIKAMTFNDPIILTSTANDYGWENVFTKPLCEYLERNDILIAISSSGQSRNILNAAKLVKERGGGVITLSGFESNNPLRSAGDINFYVSSKSYRHVERTHLFILDCVIDLFIETKLQKGECCGGEKNE